MNLFDFLLIKFTPGSDRLKSYYGYIALQNPNSIIYKDVCYLLKLILLFYEF